MSKHSGVNYGLGANLSFNKFFATIKTEHPLKLSKFWYIRRIDDNQPAILKGLSKSCIGVSERRQHSVQILAKLS